MVKCLLFTLLAFSSVASAKEYESHYQDLWCNSAKGSAEVVMEDSSRADCVTATEAIEVDFAAKWAESIGQALLYAELIVELPTLE